MMPLSRYFPIPAALLLTMACHAPAQAIPTDAPKQQNAPVIVRKSAEQVYPSSRLPSPQLNREDAIRLQIYLDQLHFGPGVIDGKIGRFTKLAIATWNEVHGHPTTHWEIVAAKAREAVANPLATALVPEKASDWVDPTLPQDRALQAKKKRMSYRSMVEFMAERYHCDEGLLRELNGDKYINALQPRQSLMVPNIQPFRIEDIGRNQHPKDEVLSRRHVVVDTRIKQVRIFDAAPAAIVIHEAPADGSPVTVVPRNQGIIASFPITPGREEFIAPGTWVLRNMVEMPWWSYDQTFLDTGVRSPVEERISIPPGPNSPVGIIWNGTSKSGIGLHGTSDPETIGRARSAGCIRLCNWDAIRLPTLIRPGATVEIR